MTNPKETLMRKSKLSVLLGAALLVLSACTSGGTASPSSAPASNPAASPASASAAASGGGSGAAACAVGSTTGTVAATIKNFAFSPNPVTAKVGESITWTNQDSAPHTVTLDDGGCTTDRIASGTSATLTFSAAGTYPFHCSVHPNMKGTIQVNG
jgi:plastocyanin